MSVDSGVVRLGLGSTVGRSNFGSGPTIGYPTIVHPNSLVRVQLRLLPQVEVLLLLREVVWEAVAQQFPSLATYSAVDPQFYSQFIL